MKALTLTSIVKDFHEILLSRTAKILDLKAGATTTIVNYLQWEELKHVWHTQAYLMRRFSEYREYAQSKGIPRIVEELMGFVLSKNSALPEDLSRTYLLPTVGCLLQVMSLLGGGEDGDDDKAGARSTVQVM